GRRADQLRQGHPRQDQVRCRQPRQHPRQRGQEHHQGPDQGRLVDDRLPEKQVQLDHQHDPRLEGAHDRRHEAAHPVRRSTARRPHEGRRPAGAQAEEAARRCHLRHPRHARHDGVPEPAGQGARRRHPVQVRVRRDRDRRGHEEARAQGRPCGRRRLGPARARTEGSSMTFPAQAMQILVELQVGDGGTWVDVTEDLRMSSGVDITRGRQDEASEVNPGKCTLVLNNRHGKYSEFNPDGPYYGRLTKNTPLRVSVAPFGDGVYYPRFAGEVSKWPPRWDISDTDVWVPIEAAGILRRIRANTEFPISSHQRFIQSNSPYTYWPMTEGEDAIEASPVFGVSKMRSISDSGALFSRQPQWGKGEIAPWMENVVAFPQEHHMVASFPV